ncbi:Glucan 1,3-beta-glucosidase [Cercospora zeina]
MRPDRKPEDGLSIRSIHEVENAAVEKRGGTVIDGYEMSRMGIVGFVTILQATWENVLLTNWFGLFNGGTAGVIWCTIAVWLLMLCMIASLAEMASMAPTAGGQVCAHLRAPGLAVEQSDADLRIVSLFSLSRVSEFAPPSLQKPLSYVVGWCCCLGWIAGVPSCCVQLAGMVQTMILLMNPEADVSRLYQATLLLYCFLVLCVGFNIFCAQQLPLAEGILLFVHVLGFFVRSSSFSSSFTFLPKVQVFLLVFWIMGDHAPAERVFREFHDGGGWGSTGLSCLVGLSTPIWCFIGPDAGAHMSEELKDASLQLPRAMMWATVLNGILGVTMLISFCFCIQDVELLLRATSNFPIIEVLFNATGSRAATCVLGAMLVVLVFFSTVTTTASASRQVWAFSRDQGIPFSKWIRFVSPGVDVPTNAILCVGLVSAVISAINFGSGTAFNAVVGVSNAALGFSYIVSIGCIRLKRFRGEELLPARWSLGRYGAVINDISLAFLAIAFVFSFFPTKVIHGNKQWAESLNWAIVIFGTTCLFALAYYTLGGRHRYISPASLSLVCITSFLLQHSASAQHHGHLRHRHLHVPASANGGTSNYTNGLHSLASALDLGPGSGGCPASQSYPPEQYWLPNLPAKDHGRSPFLVNGQNYRIFRNVKDFGAKGDGETDDTDAFNRAISDRAVKAAWEVERAEQARILRGADPTSTNGIQPALIYLPSGTYIISSTVQLWVGTQIIGDALEPPVIKASPIMRNGTQLISAFDFALQSTTNFYIGIRNIALDSTDVAPNKTIFCLNWAVSQATNLMNVNFTMPRDSQHIGIEMDGGNGGGGSGLFMGDLAFSGGLIGLHFNNQQYALKNLRFDDVKTAIAMKHAFTVTMQGIYCSNVEICVDAGMNEIPGGSFSLIDSVCDSCGVMVNASTSVLLENLETHNSGPIIRVNGQAKLTRNLLGKRLILGNVERTNGSMVPATNGSLIRPIKRDGSLVDENGRYFTKSQPQYTDLPLSAFASVKDAGAAGDGITDDTQAIQLALLANANCNKVTFFPHGVYVVTDTLYVPPGSRLVGQVLSVVTASGQRFANEDDPRPMIQIGRPGEKGVAECSDLLFSSADILPGLIIVEVNMAGEHQGDVSFHNVHYRIGGARDSLLQTSCQEVSKPCKAAFMVMHLRETSSIYIENSWMWTADHDLDDSYNQQIGTGRGLYSVSQGPTWLIGTASEHHTLYAYQFENAANVYAALMQVESPYWQPSPRAPAPWVPDAATWNDPDFSNCQQNVTQCYMQWALRILGDNTDSLHLYGMGFWVFFNGPNYGSCTGPNGSCQINIVELDDELESDNDVALYNLNTKSVVNMISDSNGTVLATQSQNSGSWGGIVVAYGNF